MSRVKKPSGKTDNSNKPRYPKCQLITMSAGRDNMVSHKTIDLKKRKGK